MLRDDGMAARVRVAGAVAREAEDQKAGARVDDSTKRPERSDKLRLTVPLLMSKKGALDLSSSLKE